MKEFIALAKARPGQFNYASSGSGAAAHLSAELFKSMTGTSMVHVPYKGAGPALIDVLAGQCQVMFATSLSVQPYIQSGRMRPLAVSEAERSLALPDVPTFREAGFQDVVSTKWFGFSAAADIPREVVARWETEVATALQSTQVREAFAKIGVRPGTLGAAA